MKINQAAKSLLSRQIFSMKKAPLQKRIVKFYQETKNTAAVIEYLVAVLIRNALINEDFSQLCAELVREIFLTAEPSDVIRRYSPFFESFFNEDEWQKNILTRLFRNMDTKTARQLTEKARNYNKLLNTPGSGEQNNPDLQLKIVSIFEDSNGKKRTLTIKDADETQTKAETENILAILTMLEIFENENGVQRFAKFLKSNRPGMIETFTEEPVEESLETSAKNAESGTTEPTKVQIMVPYGFDPRTLSEQEVLALARVHLPEHTSLKNLQVDFIEEQPPAEEEKTAGPVITAPITEDFLQINADDRKIETQTNAQAAVADLPPVIEQKTKKQKPLTHQGAYRQGIIERWRKRYSKE